MYHSINIGDKNTWDDWHLVPQSRPLVNPPEVKTEYFDIPGANGSLDYTEALTGAPVYKDRTGSWDFIVMNGYQKWYELYNALLNYLHGKKHIVVLEDEPEYYYEGRLSINNWKSSEHYSTITIDYTLSPYKRSTGAGDIDWKWDDLTMSGDTYIIYYGSFDVHGKRYRTIYNPTNEPLDVEFIATSSMEAKLNGQTIHISSGSNIGAKALHLQVGENYLEITDGVGTISMSYTRGDII